MKRKSLSKIFFLFTALSAALGMFVLSACELIVDFDRTNIDAGQNADTGAQPPPDSSLPDVITPVDSGNEAAADAATDAPDDG